MGVQMSGVTLWGKTRHNPMTGIPEHRRLPQGQGNGVQTGNLMPNGNGVKNRHLRIYRIEHLLQRNNAPQSTHRDGGKK